MNIRTRLSVKSVRRGLVQGSVLSLALCGTVFAATDGETATQQNAPQAGSANPPAAPPDKTAAELGNVTVTAQSRTQEVQAVPIAMQIVTEKQIEALAVTDLSKMNGYIPGLYIDGAQPTQPFYSLRGISVQDFGIGTDSPIGIYQDGVYAGKTGGALLMFNDIQRVEVLKGPQGTLFGRNSAGGAISVATNEPGDGWEESARVRLGNAGLRYFDGVLNVPLGQDVAFRMSFVDNQSNGWLRDAATGQHYEKNDDWGARAQLKWNAPGDTTVRLSFEHEVLNQPARPGISVISPASYVNGVAPYPADPNTYIDPRTAQVRNDVVDDKEARNFTGGTLHIEHSFAFGDLASTTAYRHFSTINREEYDGTHVLADYLDSLNQERNTSWSQEFKLSGKNDLADWVGGLSYYYDNAHQTSGIRFFTDSIDTLLNNTGLAPGGLYGPVTQAFQANGFQYSLLGDPWNEAMYNHGIAKAHAAYGDVIWHLSDRWNLTTGVRFTHDQRRFDWHNPTRSAPQLDATLADPVVQSFLQEAGIPLAAFQQNIEFNTPVSTGAPLASSNSWSDVSPRLVLDYKLDPNVMLYASVTKGYQAGGFNALLPASHYGPETIRNYEGGIKSYFPDYRLLLNASVYYYKYSNLQSLNLVQNGNGALPQYLVTISDQQAKGLDFEAHWQATDELRVNATATYIDATYQHGTSSTGADLSGQPVGEPLWSAAAGLDYVWHGIANGDLDLSIMDAYRGSTRCNSDSVYQGTCLTTPTFSVGKAQNRTDLRLGWSAAPWTLAVFVNNAFDKRYVSSINNVSTSILGTPFASITAPRLWGVEAAVQF
jgi:iron complex outermembrane receptor protein